MRGHVPKTPKNGQKKLKTKHFITCNEIKAVEMYWIVASCPYLIFSLLK
jgi:hypothetical protein